MKTMTKSSIASSLILAVTLALSGCAALPDSAADATDHSAHHPEGAASAPKTPDTKANAPVAQASPSKLAATSPMGMMDTKMQAMHAMHEKMMAAKTPEARSALMADHMKTMQDAMAMMGSMGGKEGMGMMGGMQGKDAGAMQGQMPADMAMRQQMMEKRMEMMASMMQMMMDRMAPAAATK